MKIKKFFLTSIVGFFLATSAFAGKEDWTGSFYISNGGAYGSWIRIEHNSKYVSFDDTIFSDQGVHLSKGSQYGSITLKEDVDLLRASNTETFVAEVKKIGPIQSKSIYLGPTYFD